MHLFRLATQFPAADPFSPWRRRGIPGSARVFGLAGEQMEKLPRGMKKAVLARLFLLPLVFTFGARGPAQGASSPQAGRPEIITVAEVRRGMRGTAWTVFEGTQPEPIGVEILGVLKDVNGPKGDVIIARLQGGRIEYTGVVAGMSGSPVYVDGKLLGAIAFRIGLFSKEAIAGITPIEYMLEINEMDRSPAPQSQAAPSAPRATVGRSASPATGDGDDLEPYAQYLTPIEAPLVFSGFSADTVQRFAPRFASAGVVPVMGAGGASNAPQPEPLVPGSAVSAELIRGDMNIAATCTVTYADAERLLACGHPLLQFGMVDIPMTKANVVTTVASPYVAFKIVNSTEEAGSFVQDRHTGILGRFQRAPEMIPVTVTVHGSSHPKQFHFEVLNNPRLTPVAVMATVYNALQGVNESGEEITYRMQGKIAVAGYPDVGLQNMYAPGENAFLPTAFMVAMALGDRFGRIYDNPYERPNIRGVELDFDLVRERRWARLESARTDVTEARPGDEITVEAVLRPYRGERIVRQIPVKVPTSTPKGTLHILISDGETLDRARRMSSGFSRRLDLGNPIALLNKEHLNHFLYVSLLEPNPQAMVEDKVMPALPLSVMNVMEGMRGTQDMVVVGESAVNESATPLDYVVSGSQIISVTIK